MAEEVLAAPFALLERRFRLLALRNVVDDVHGPGTTTPSYLTDDHLAWKRRAIRTQVTGFDVWGRLTGCQDRVPSIQDEVPDVGIDQFDRVHPDQPGGFAVAEHASGTLIAVDDRPLNLNDEGVRDEVSKLSILTVRIRQIRTVLDFTAIGDS
jgi:hypothetical protein